MCQAIKLHARRRWLLTLVGGLGSCAFVRQKDFDAHKQQQQEREAFYNAEIQSLKNQLERERTQREIEARRIASRAVCDNEKLRAFLKECEEGSEVCSDKGVENAWKFIISQPGVVLYLRPHAGEKGIVQTRRGQLMSTCDPKTWLPSTRFLILVKPRSESSEHHEEAMRIGREVRNYLTDELFPNQKDLRTLGPKTLPCKMKVEEVSNYSGNPLPYPIKGEPQGREPAVRVWVYRTDC